MRDAIIGRRRFTDGSARDVLQALDDRQRLAFGLSRHACPAKVMDRGTGVILFGF